MQSILDQNIIMQHVTVYILDVYVNLPFIVNDESKQ